MESKCILGRIGSIGSSVLAVIFSAHHAVAAPIITAVSPENGFSNTAVTVTGLDFTAVTEVVFHSFPAGNRFDAAAFTAAADGRIDAVLPQNSRFDEFNQWVVSVYSAEGAAMALPDSVHEVTGTTLGHGNGGVAYLVRAGGVLTGAVSQSVIFVEAGGTFVLDGYGANLIFVADGGSFSGPDGGGTNSIYYEPLANLAYDAGGGGGNFAIQLPELNYTILGREPPIVVQPPAAVPEPSAAMLFLLGFGTLAGMARRARKRA